MRLKFSWVSIQPYVSIMPYVTKKTKPNVKMHIRGDAQKILDAREFLTNKKFLDE